MRNAVRTAQIAFKFDSPEGIGAPNGKDVLPIFLKFRRRLPASGGPSVRTLEGGTGCLSVGNEVDAYWGSPRDTCSTLGRET